VGRLSSPLLKGRTKEGFIISMVSDKLNKDTLVAIINSKRDLDIALKQQWYRIPVKTKYTPQSVKNETLKHIAFYQISVFGRESFLIKWYAEVRDISIIKRSNLLPDEISDPKANNDYYKINLNELKTLPNPIISQRHRRMLFVNTTLELLLKAKEFNDLFLESDLEEKLWTDFKSSEINAERQYMFVAEKRFYYLDFALFCRDKTIDVECDGDEYHLTEDAVKYDKRRNNFITKYGWIVLRYGPEEISNNMNSVMKEINKTVKRYGGIEPIPFSKNFRHFRDEDNQIDLFN